MGNYLLTVILTHTQNQQDNHILMTFLEPITL